MPVSYYFIKRYTRKELEAMTPIEQGHMDSLLLENKDEWRLWQSRMTKEDGAAYNNLVTVEFYNPETGKWETHLSYEPR